MTSVAINFRNLAVALAAIGLSIGAAFGAGIAYGRTDDGSSTTTAATGSGQAGGGNLFPGGQGGAGQGGGGGFQALFGGATTGTITAAEGDTVTIETAQGSREVHVGDATAISLLQTVELSALTPGTVVIVSGDERDDGSLDATSINQLPPQLEGLGTGTPPNAGGGGGSQGGGGPQVPEPTASPVEAEPTPTTLPDRTSCDEIRGTEYRSAGEREFFLANCLEG
ncbi:MAG TPA: DUF5666 domain-containing protein [Dehalococcoidia bacterium]|nr:DUF5666 domain-containing protein [Dehalococcoidia bacterium]